MPACLHRPREPAPLTVLPQDEIIKPKYSPDQVPQAFPQVMESLGLKTQLQNLVHQLHAQATQNMCHTTSRIAVQAQQAERPMPPIPQLLESNSCISQAREQWRTFLLEQLTKFGYCHSALARSLAQDGVRGCDICLGPGEHCEPLQLPKGTGETSWRQAWAFLFRSKVRAGL